MNKAQESSREIRSLTGLRAIAAVWVVAYHLSDGLRALFPGLSPIWTLFSPGYLGVDIFFVLSGYILSYNYHDRLGTTKEYFRFLWLRLARIYPVHLVTLGALAAMVLVAPIAGISLARPELFTMSTFLQNLLLIQGWAIPVKMSWNYVSWSVSNEWAAYIAFPFVIKLVRLKNRIVGASLGFGSLLLLPICAGLYPMPDPADYGLVRLILEFTAGCLLFQASRQHNGAPYPWHRFTLLSAVGILVGGVLLAVRDHPAFWVVPLVGPLVLGLAQQQCFTARLLSSAAAVYWGKVSYSLYMTHAICLTVLSKVLPWHPFTTAHLAVRIGVVGAYLVVFTLTGTLTYHLVEEPARIWMRTLGRRSSRTTGLPVGK